MILKIAGTLDLEDSRRTFWWVQRIQDDETRAADPYPLSQLLFGPFFLVVAVILAFGNQAPAAVASVVAGVVLIYPGLIKLPGRLRDAYGVLPVVVGENPEMLQLRWAIDEQGVVVTDGRPAEARTVWDDYRDYAEDESGFLLYWWPEPGADLEALGDREQIVHYLPRRFFQAGDAEVLSEFLRQRFAIGSQK